MTVFEPSAEIRRSDLPMYLVENPGIPTGPGSRNTFGGRPILPESEDWPECYCGARMVLFFQLDVPPDIPRFGGDHLLVFQCPVHNDAACLRENSEQLPRRYWEEPRIWGHPGAFWRIMLHRDATGPADAEEPHLLGCELVLRPECETETGWRAVPSGEIELSVGRGEFKVGGLPRWQQDPEGHRCACGAEMLFLCGLPEDVGFKSGPGQPEQPDSSYSDAYVLFLGNAVYLLACPEHCHPAAVWPVPQN
ncbi:MULTISPECIES: hypothetical protein [Actinomycetes]|uniref:hypothetical protein n=1 Tax=Actinomycetes TaxID=1760 RepID=UPI0001B56037|nr:MULTISPECIES: hypothetical protein [Actinomycetes]EFL07374.1 predicted protein [Streptomyces sp. AA4]